MRSIFMEVSATNIFNTFIRNIAKTDLIIVSDYGKGTIFNARKLIQSAKKLKKKILLIPKEKILQSTRCKF